MFNHPNDKGHPHLNGIAIAFYRHHAKSTLPSDQAILMGMRLAHHSGVSSPLSNALILVLSILLAGTSSNSSAQPRFERHIPKFGTPLVLSNQVIFTWPDARQPKLISINRDTGEKVWEMSVTNKDVQLWPVTNSPVVTIGSTLFTLNVAGGALDYRTDIAFPVRELREIAPNLLLVERQAADIRTNGLAALRTTDWTKAWFRTNISQLIDADSKRVLVRFAEPDYSGTQWWSHGWPMTNMRIGLLDAESGGTIWQQPPSALSNQENAILAGEYVVVGGATRIACLSARDGSVITGIPPFSHQTFPNFWHDGRLFTDKSTDAVATLEVPSLSGKTLFTHQPELVGAEDRFFVGDVFLIRGRDGACAFDARTGRKLWPRETPRIILPDAAWAWHGVFENTIYVSKANLADQKASIFKLDLRTGKSRELFSSSLPRPN